jgi:hypothetical protein
MRHHVILAICAIVFFCISREAMAGPIPLTQVNNDLWDVAQGTTITSTSTPSTTSPPLAGILGFATGPQLAQDSYFADGKAPGFSHFIEFQTAGPVTIRSLNVWGGDDRSTGNAGRRAFTEFRLYGWNGSAFVLLLDDPITVPYTSQGPFGSNGALIVQQNIPNGYTSDKWRAEFVQPAAYQGTLYGPRVLEMDGFGTFIDGTTGPASAPLPPAIFMGSLTAGLIAWRKRRVSQ